SSRIEEKRNGDDALTVGVEEFLPLAGTGERLQELEVHIADHDFRPPQREFNGPAVHVRVVVYRGYVIVDLPGPPPEGLVICRHGGINISHDERSWGTPVGQAAIG